MRQSSESFWTDIKTYEERLKDDPTSYCFADLAELYLKVGMTDDALAVTRSGVARYPEYVLGQFALAKACREKGLYDECRIALEAVVSATPDHLEAQRMLARLYADAGQNRDAMQALQAVLRHSPDDAAARIELEALRRGSRTVIEDDDDLELIELTESDIYEEPEPDQLVERVKPPVQPIVDPWSAVDVDIATSQEPPQVSDPWASPVIAVSVAPAAALFDPLKTATLAELYVAQGFTDKALDIYRDMLDVDPANATAAARVAELELQAVQPLPVQPEELVPVNAVKLSAVGSVAPESVPSEGTADAATIAVLEGWLENIRRIRECR